MALGKTLLGISALAFAVTATAPERIPLGDPLSGSGPDAALVLETDLMGEIGVFERGATVDQTAYALLSDLLEIVRRRRSKP